MRKLVLFILFSFIISMVTYSQKGESGFGLYMGYGMARYTPGLGNLKSTMYLYDQKYGANFNYKGFLSGPAFGVRIVKGFWQTDLEWLFRHSVNESTFIEPNSNEEWKMGFKTRYNTWFWGNAFRYKNFAIGAGVDIGYFKIFNKRSKVDEYDSQKWSQNTIYGSKIMLSKALAITGGFMFYVDYMPQFFGLRLYYSIPMATEEFANDATLSFYSFKPSNVGLTLFFNFSSIK